MINVHGIILLPATLCLPLALRASPIELCKQSESLFVAAAVLPLPFSRVNESAQTTDNNDAEN